MVEHIRVGHQRRGPVAIDLEPKVPAADTHAGPFEFLQGAEVLQFRCDLANAVVILRDGLVPVGDLGEEVTALEVGEFFL